jgi:hypothetical protein
MAKNWAQIMEHQKAQDIFEKEFGDFAECRVQAMVAVCSQAGDMFGFGIKAEDGSIVKISLPIEDALNLLVQFVVTLEKAQLRSMPAAGRA